MRILVLTRSSWNDTNSTGNTMSNIFAGYDPEKIANIYCRSAKPDNSVCKYYYSISEKDLLKSVFNIHYKPGKPFTINGRVTENTKELRDQETEELFYSFFRKKPSILALWAQDILWRIGRWRNNTLDQFLSHFKPDIIFAPSFHTRYTYRLLWYIQSKTGANVVLFHADDYLTVKGLGGSLLSQINRWLRAVVVIQSANRADINYCISPKQQEEYSKKIHSEMKLLYKGADFTVQPSYAGNNERNLIRIVYIGSILYGRWKTLAILAKAIQEINTGSPKFMLMIYSQYQPTAKVKKQMIIEGASEFVGKVPADQVLNVLSDSDIVLHVESFDKKERMETRLSFSTKIVDCLHSGRCVMAIGWKEAASIDYLIKNDAALVATDETEVRKRIKEVIENPSIINKYAKKAWICGKNNHYIKEIQSKLISDFLKLCNDN